MSDGCNQGPAEGVDAPGPEEPDLFSAEILAIAELGLVDGILLPDEVEALCRAVLRMAADRDR